MTPKPFDIADLDSTEFDEIIDVRAPAEFALDHLPGAVNLPVLTDAERAEVGTIYTRVSRFEARKRGAALVSANIAAHLGKHLADRPGGYKPLVYCWRGGQRSGAMALVLAQIGWRVSVLNGGYRAYRRQVVAEVYDAPPRPPVIVLDGRTGTAKTEILGLLGALAVQVVDLEGLAGHRGSLFGSLPGQAQPSQKLFESRLAAALRALDPARPVVVEGESSKIGSLALPRGLWHAMHAAPRISVAGALASRAHYLTSTYRDICADTVRLGQVLDRLVALQGHERVDAWRALAAAGAFEALAEGLMAQHYDPAYDRSMARHKAPVLGTVVLGRMDADDLARAAGEIAALAGPVA